MNLRTGTNALIAVIVIAGCSGSAGLPTSSQVLPTSSAAPARIEVGMTDEMRFVPAQLNVPVGVPVTFILTNEGVIDHEFFIGDEHEQDHHEEEMLDSSGSMAHDEPGGVSVQPGQANELTYTFERAGTTLAGCHIPGHYDAGMKATITVTS